MAAIFAGPRHKFLKVAGSTAAGAAIQGAVTSGRLQQYTVHLVSGGEVKVSTEQLEIRDGDCVSVETGAHANIRRVSTFHCESKAKEAPHHHTSAATDCQKAKDQLANATADGAIENAIKKVRILCED